MHITRHPQNPIVQAGTYPWRKVAVFNPAVILDDGTFTMLERAVPSLRPFSSALGLLRSRDGVRFEHVQDTPVMTAASLGYPHGGIQDPRLVRIDDLFYLVFVLRPFCNDCNPTGVGVPIYQTVDYPDRDPREPNESRSGIAVSKNLVDYELVGYTHDPQHDDRDNILFPEKINGRFALLRRPQHLVGPDYGTDRPSIWISYSDDLRHWDDPVLVAAPEQPWEAAKIGGSTPPLRTEQGWLTLYHGVDAQKVYRAGALLLDLHDPSKIIARTRSPILEPETYYEKFGLVIPNVVFPSANVVHDGQLYIYYGVCDTAICLATVPLDELVAHVLSEK